MKLSFTTLILMFIPLLASAQQAVSLASPALTAKSAPQTTGGSDWWSILLEKNPGVVTIFISSFLLPVIILFLTNRQNRKVKELDSKTNLDKIKAEKDFQFEFDAKSQQRNHESTVHSSLIKILFEVQRLHIELSGDCVDYACVQRAVESFQSAFAKYQAIISDNQLFLSSAIINHLYAFYRHLSELLIELQSLKQAEKVDLAIVSVYNASRALADEIIAIQEVIVKRRNDITTEFDKAHLEMMRNCCGRAPRPEVMEQYNKLKRLKETMPEPVEAAITRE